VAAAFEFDGGGFVRAIAEPRAGGIEDAAVIAEVTGRRGRPSLTVSVEHRCAGASSWSVAGTLGWLGDNVHVVKRMQSLEEEIRFVFEYCGVAPGDRLRCVVDAVAWPTAT